MLTPPVTKIKNLQKTTIPLDFSSKIWYAAVRKGVKKMTEMHDLN